MRVRPALPALAVVTALALTACVANDTGEGATGADGAAASGAAGPIAVTSTDDACEVASAEATSGTLTFEVSNTGSQVTEFYLMAEDGLRIVGEVENIAPGASRTLTATVQPGSYLTLCKPGMLGSGVGQAAFTVSGEQVVLAGDDAEQMQEAVTLYAAFVKDQVGELLPAVQAFVDAYTSGDDETAREMFPQVRAYYERIEPVAEALGDLDPRIDYREVDARAEELDWTGFHRIEKDLWEPAEGDLNSDGSDAFLDWEPSSPEQRGEFGDLLVADVTELYDYVHSDDFTTYLDDQGIDWISNGAIGLLDEVATGKITGEEDWWSGTDLWDFAANVEGSQMAFSLVQDLAATKDPELVTEISDGYTALSDRLADFGSLEDGFVGYSELNEQDKKDLSDLINALAEPLSQLTTTVLS